MGRLGEGGQLLGGGWGVPDKKNAVGGVGPAGVPDGDRPVFRPEAGGAAGAGGRPFPLGPLPWAASVAWFRARREGAQARVRIRAEEGCRAAGRISDGAAAGLALIQATRGSGGCCGAAWWSPGGAAAGVALIQATREGVGGGCRATWGNPGGAAAGEALIQATRRGREGAEGVG